MPEELLNKLLFIAVVMNLIMYKERESHNGLKIFGCIEGDQLGPCIFRPFNFHFVAK